MDAFEKCEKIVVAYFKSCIRRKPVEELDNILEYNSDICALIHEAAKVKVSPIEQLDGQVEIGEWLETLEDKNDTHGEA